LDQNEPSTRPFLLAMSVKLSFSLFEEVRLWFFLQKRQISAKTPVRTADNTWTPDLVCRPVLSQTIGYFVKKI